ncbi:MAG: hypothetical protein KAT37_03690 [Candidatus Aenigmarchaeota archaeon]|nr:hypothetical protein [Candidatus Aenigmarchaeota archaeon]
MFGKRGVSPFIAFVLVVSISVATTVLIIRAWDTSLDKTKNYAKINEAKGVMNSINSAIKEVAAEGEGSSRKLSFSTSGGEYRVSSSEDSITFVMDSREELFSQGMSTREGDLYMEVYQNYTVKLKLNYTNIDIITDKRWSSGSYNFIVKNNGTSSGKTELVFDIV